MEWNSYNMLKNIFKTKQYFFYSKLDSTKEHIGETRMSSRLDAARYFASRKCLTLKAFLTIYSVTR